MSVSNIQRRAYSSDLTLAQWGILSPMLRPNTGRGRRNIHDLKDIVDAILYINVNGCKWVDLPHDFPPPTSVSHHYRKWSKDGTWRQINDTLREAVREQAGRDPHPSLGAIDSQTMKAAATGGARGYGRETHDGPEKAHPGGHAGSARGRPRDGRVCARRGRRGRPVEADLAVRSTPPPGHHGGQRVSP